MSKKEELPMGTVDIIKLDIESGLTIEKAIDNYVTKNNAEDLRDKLKEYFAEKGFKRYRNCFSSDLIDDDTFFHTIYIQNEGKYKPVIVTSKGEILNVFDNEELLKQETEISEKIKITDEDRFFYFDYHGARYKFYTELFFRDTFRIYTVDNNILYFIKQKKIPGKEIYDEDKTIFEEYYDHPNPFEYDIITVFTLTSYILRALGKTFYYIPQGREDTGKSTLQKGIARLQFNGRFSGKGSIASTVRLIHFLGCNINQDEFDKLSKDEKHVFCGVANSGLYSDGVYTIVDVNKKRLKDQITDFFSFSNKSFSTNNLWQFDKSFLSRCYINICVRQARKLKDINDVSEQEEQRFQIQRDRNFLYCLFNWKAIKDDILSVKKELEGEGVFGRKTDMNSLILGVVKHFKGDYYLEVKKHLLEKEGVEQEEQTDTKEAIVFEYLVDKFKEEEKVVEVENKDIYDYLLEKLGIPESSDKKPKAQSIGWILKNHNLLPRKENLGRTGEGRRKYTITRSSLLDTLRRFNYPILIQNLTSDSSVPSVPSASSEESEESEENELGSSFNKHYKKLQQLHEKYGDKKFPKSELEDVPEEVVVKLLDGGTIFKPDKNHFQIMRPEDFRGNSDV